MTTVTEEKVQILKEKFLRSGYFFAALFFHIIIFLLVATIIIWKAPEVRNEGEFQPVQMVKIQPPLPTPPSASGDSARNPQLDPQPVTVPVSTPLSVISTANSSFSINADKLMSQTLSHVNLSTPTGAGMTIETITIDVLMGDEPGGFYNAYFLIAEDGRTYPLSPEKVPLYPIFQLGTEQVKRSGDEPPHSTVAEPWAGVT